MNNVENIRFDISCIFSPKGSVCIKCQILFSGKNKKNISRELDLTFHTNCLLKKCQILFSWKNKQNISLSSAESVHRF